MVSAICYLLSAIREHGLHRHPRLRFTILATHRAARAGGARLLRALSARRPGGKSAGPPPARVYPLRRPELGVRPRRVGAPRLCSQLGPARPRHLLRDAIARALPRRARASLARARIWPRPITNYQSPIPPLLCVASRLPSLGQSRRQSRSPPARLPRGGLVGQLRHCSDGRPRAQTLFSPIPSPN